MNTTTYQVYWISDRGFANEGDFVYGTPDAIQADIDRFTRSTPKTEACSNHRSMATARAAAIKEARKARREYLAHETFAIGVREAGQEQSQEDWEAVRY